MNRPQKYETVIGLEIHAQLLTQSKMFCGCSTKFGAAPNTQTCPICTGMPGVLPVINKRAVEMAIRAGLATHCRIAPYSRFARKNYFYPDLPKGYQISQYELPLCEQGSMEVGVNGGHKRIGITRIHMEEDAGKNLHEGIAGASHVDLNRAGVPLLEIVSEPDIRSAEEAVAYLKKFRDILVYLEVCDGNMEEGSLRCDANVSLRPIGQKEFGTKTELKNINSFRFVQKALEYEITRQMKTLEEGGRIVQETRLWDTERGVTASMRSKEEAHDYRYFPEPDLVPLEVPVDWIEEIRKTLPELPQAKRERFVREYSIPEYDAEVLTAEKPIADYFETCAKNYKNYKNLSNWILTELLRELKSDGRQVGPEDLVKLLTLMDQGTINRNTGKKVFEEMSKTSKSPEEIIREQGLTQLSDDHAIELLIDNVLAANPKELAGYRQGKEKLFGFFVGQVMKQSDGKANPAKVNELLKKKLQG
ncbi:MAG: Asp-tRNA(Asn)/Glu-tRNA(Gln) amidotransferase subunit GatB [Nitrospira sp.]|nr:Asp-tRNA(Asn)/Glu-tRNA(Gln) amidotransferase subunit GatB [Nitrospira sp.]